MAKAKKAAKKKKSATKKATKRAIPNMKTSRIVNFEMRTYRSNNNTT